MLGLRTQTKGILDASIYAAFFLRPQNSFGLRLEADQINTLAAGVLYRDISILVYAYILMDCFKNHGLG